ncbi:MAG: DUF4843 domain-containing protein [Bacteroidota bacterium]
MKDIKLRNQMKSIYKVFLFALVAFSLGSCIEQDFAYEIYDGSVVEFDATVLNGPAPGEDFPIVNRLPAYGFALNTSRPFITESSGTITFRVNFVSAQRPNDETITYSVVADKTTAVEGVHYNTSGSFVIPANSSFGEVTVELLEGDNGTSPVTLVLELNGNGSDIAASENFKRLGISIAQQ